MLRIVHVYDLEGVTVSQAGIKELLGVSGATISRMLKSLEELGYIVRERLKWRPGLYVGFTEEGRALVKRVMASLIDNGAIDDQLDDMVEGGDDALAVFDEHLTFFRTVYEDPARFSHPWRCGGLDTVWKPHWGRCA